MKVKCIANASHWSRKGMFTRKWPWSKKVPVPAKGPGYGDFVTVENEYHSDGEKYYNLYEWPGVGGYEAKWFVPIEENKKQEKEVTFSEIQKELPATLPN